MSLVISTPVDNTGARYWRINCTAPQSGNYLSLGEVYFYHAGVDISLNGSAFASSTYPGTNPAFCFDKDPNTLWSSSGGTQTSYIAYDLVTPKLVTSVGLVFPTDYGAVAEAPKNYTIQRSSNKTTWATVATVTNDPAWSPGERRDIVLTTGAPLSGVAKLDNGQPASKVVAFDWSTGSLVGVAVPGADGTFSLNVTGEYVGVVVMGPAGYQPVAHGPIQVSY